MGKRKQFVLTVTALVTAMLLGGTAGAQEPPILVAAAHRLCDLQADTFGDNARNGLIDTDPDDGGWDWEFHIGATEHSPDPSPDNIYGVTALGLLTFIEESSPPHTSRFITALIDAYLGIYYQPGAVTAPDVVFLARLTNVDPNHNYHFANLGRVRYDTRVALHGGPAGLAQYVADGRGQAGHDGLVPWDLGWLAEAAIELDRAYPLQGYSDHAKLYARAIADDIGNPSGYFQIDKPNEPYYTLGLAAVARTMMLTGYDSGLRNDAYVRLAGMQKLNGAYPLNGPISEASYQATAYAIKAWHALEPHPYAATANTPAVQWLASKQTTLGGWEFTRNRECSEVDGEILTALSLSLMGRRGLMQGNDIPSFSGTATDTVDVPEARPHAPARPLSF